MDYKTAVNQRCSRRTYTEKRSIQLIVDNGEAFDGFRKSYGMFSGARNYLALVGKTADRDRMEKEGYFGEKLVLEATELGLSTCWVGTNYDKDSCVCSVRDDETLDLVIALGYAEKNHSLRERFMESVTHRKTKTLGQPILFIYQNGTVTAEIQENSERVQVDLGIAKLHFEIGSGRSKEIWGQAAKCP